MFNCYIIRYSEIGIKGKNRIFFEKKLIRNIKDCLKKNNIKYNKILRLRNRIIVYSKDNCSCLKNVFGISSISPTIEINQTIEDIKKTALSLYKKGTFRITSKRLDKKFKLTSEQLNKEIGAFIVKEKKAKVSLKNPNVEIGIELFNNKAYLFNQKISGLNGLPISTGGKVAVLLENKDSLLTAFLMMKRGCSITLIKKKDIDYKILKKFSYGITIKTFTNIPKDVKAIVTSETLDNIKKSSYKLPIIRPLISYDKNKVLSLMKNG